MITMEFDKQQLDEILKRYSSESIDKAESRALTKTKNRVLTAITRAITAEYNIKARDVKKHIKVKRIGKSLVVEIGEKNFPLVRFTTHRLSRATIKTIPRIKIKKNGHSTRLHYMFYAVMQSGHIGMYMRARAMKKRGFIYGAEYIKRIKEKYNKRGKELAINEITAIDSVDMFKKVEAEDKALEMFRDTFQSEVVRQLSNGLV